MEEPTGIDTIVDKLYDLYRSVDWHERHLLERKGWTNTSQTPGSYVVWRKKYDDGYTVTDQKTALKFEGITKD